MRPLKALRYLVRFGLSIALAPRRRLLLLLFVQALVLRHWIVRQDLALEYPDLDPAGAVGGHGGRLAVIDIGTQRVQRHTALAVPFQARDLRAAETARAVDADALRT